MPAAFLICHWTVMGASAVVSALMVPITAELGAMVPPDFPLLSRNVIRERTIAPFCITFRVRGSILQTLLPVFMIEYVVLVPTPLNFTCKSLGNG